MRLWILLAIVYSPLPLFAQGIPAPGEALLEATRLFQQGSQQPKKYSDAAKYFAAAFQKVEMSTDQLAAWAYCRVRLAHDDLNRSPYDPKVATQVVAEVEDALRLAPSYVKLQKTGADVLRQARQVQGVNTSSTAPLVASFEILGDHPETWRRLADKSRETIFGRWTGKPAPSWSVACQVVLHQNADSFTRATNQPASKRGHASIELQEGRVTKRRLDILITGDRETLEQDVLPRELTHIILVDLFPVKPPPTWAAIGMAHLATSEREQSRYRQLFTTMRSKLLPLEMVLNTAEPNDPLMYHVQCAVFVNYLTKWRGEKEFVGAIAGINRYGAEGGLRHAYSVQSLGQLERQWLTMTP
jgi:hypothetical protein